MDEMSMDEAKTLPGGFEFGKWTKEQKNHVLRNVSARRVVRFNLLDGELLICYESGLNVRVSKRGALTKSW